MIGFDAPRVLLTLPAMLVGTRTITQAVIAQLPEVDVAHSIFADPDPLRRWSLEARILTGETFGAIAGKVWHR